MQRTPKTPAVKAKKKHSKLRPEWDDSVHDLSVHRLSPNALLRRHLSVTPSHRTGLGYFFTPLFL